MAYPNTLDHVRRVVIGLATVLPLVWLGAATVTYVPDVVPYVLLVLFAYAAGLWWEIRP